MVRKKYRIMFTLLSYGIKGKQMKEGELQCKISKGKTEHLNSKQIAHHKKERKEVMARNDPLR